MGLTEAEQNRLIIGNRELVEPIASAFRGMKGIPFEDMVATGMVGLVKAARGFDPELSLTSFVDWAQNKIKWEIKDLLREWQPVVAIEDAGLDHENERGRFYEWTCWQYATPYEAWENLAASPEELRLLFEQTSGRQDAFNAAMISLEPTTRRMIRARFFRDPPQTLESIARDHKISLQSVSERIFTALKNMRKQTRAYERNRRKPNKREKSNIVAFPARAVRIKVTAQTTE